MADGEVTDEERELARRAVFECVVSAGADTTFELFDVDPAVQQHYFEEYSTCLGEYPGLPRMNEGANDQFALDLLGVVECTEDRTAGTTDLRQSTRSDASLMSPRHHRQGAADRPT